MVTLGNIACVYPFLVEDYPPDSESSLIKLADKRGWVLGPRMAIEIILYPHPDNDVGNLRAGEDGISISSQHRDSAEDNVLHICFIDRCLVSGVFLSVYGGA